MNPALPFWELIENDIEIKDCLNVLWLITW